jgi:hypothetical protein
MAQPAQGDKNKAVKLVTFCVVVGHIQGHNCADVHMYDKISAYILACLRAALLLNDTSPSCIVSDALLVLTWLGTKQSLQTEKAESAPSK